MPYVSKLRINAEGSRNRDFNKNALFVEATIELSSDDNPDQVLDGWGRWLRGWVNGELNEWQPPAKPEEPGRNGGR